ncbi:hypothetical protein E4U41_004190 [Claviceps citrina]|nr:hypothetical protein E4U41_004190 [Claviceps citrina]
MKFLTVLSLLTSASAIAVPGRGARKGMQSRPVQRISSSEAVSKRDTTPWYNPNWAGAVLVSKGFHYVEGTITVPKVTGRQGVRLDGAAAAAWVGIDGSECPQAILQTGVSFYTDGTFDAWYEWYPDYSHKWDDFKISVGDQIKMIVNASSVSSGYASLENLTTGQKVLQTIPKAPKPICGTTAEWIVEDFSNNDKLVPFANFGKITFVNNRAMDSTGVRTPAGADIYEIQEAQSKKILTKSQVIGSEVTCQHLGN